MADYINSNILFQAYTHVDAELGDFLKEHPNAQAALQQYLEKRAKHFLYEKVQAELKFGDGSIKAYATVRGTLRECLPDAYQSFSNEIDRLFWFAKRLSDAAVVEVVFGAGAYIGAIMRTEARPGVIGQTKRAIDSMRALRTVIDSDRMVKIQIRLATKGLAATKNLLKVIADDGDKALVKKEFLALLKKKPATLNLGADKQKNEYATLIDEWKKLLS